MPGLAHFCEHLLFMVGMELYPINIYLMRSNQGTDQYPKENEYSEVCI
jgi:secreted Zn-dependent insulinase-like peptidase